MLCQFSFSNFKSFKEEVLLDLFGEAISEHENSLIIDKDGSKFLPVAVLYGPNGGGKSTVLEALKYLRNLVVDRVAISLLDGSEQKETIQSILDTMSEFGEKYHKFDSACKKLPTTFDILFRFKNKEYRYQLSILHKEVTDENLYRRKLGEKKVEIVFERTTNDYFLGEAVSELNVEKVRSSMPFLSHFAINYNIDVIDDVIRWLMQITILDFNNPGNERRFSFPKKES